MKEIILASGSPRRRRLLEMAGLVFSVDPAVYEERMIPGVPPRLLAEQNARGKALEAAGRHPGAVIISADTIVVLGDEVLGKPAGEDDARRMLLSLSGREHTVITGFTVIDSSTGREQTGSSVTKVVFRDMDEREVEDYVKSGEPLDKAGAYAIQGEGAAFVKSMEGDMDNVVGLPVADVLAALGKMGAA